MSGAGWLINAVQAGRLLDLPPEDVAAWAARHGVFRVSTLEEGTRYARDQVERLAAGREVRL